MREAKNLQRSHSTLMSDPDIEEWPVAVPRGLGLTGDIYPAFAQHLANVPEGLCEAVGVTPPTQVEPYFPPHPPSGLSYEGPVKKMADIVECCLRAILPPTRNETTVELRRLYAKTAVSRRTTYAVRVNGRNMHLHPRVAYMFSLVYILKSFENAWDTRTLRGCNGKIYKWAQRELTAGARAAFSELSGLDSFTDAHQGSTGPVVAPDLLWGMFEAIGRFFCTLMGIVDKVVKAPEGGCVSMCPAHRVECSGAFVFEFGGTKDRNPVERELAICGKCAENGVRLVPVTIRKRRRAEDGDDAPQAKRRKRNTSRPSVSELIRRAQIRVEMLRIAEEIYP